MFTINVNTEVHTKNIVPIKKGKNNCRLLQGSNLRGHAQRVFTL